MSGSLAAALVRGILIVSSLLALYTAGVQPLSDTTQRALHWTLMAAAIFLSPQGKDGQGPRWHHWLLAAAAAASGLYAVFVWPERVLKVGDVPITDTVMGTITIALALVAAARHAGLTLSIAAGVFLVYALWGPYFPGVLAHRGVGFRRLVDFLFMTTEGVFGTPMGVSATYIIMFVIFGAALSAFGTGNWFVDLSYAIGGRFRGGPAKTAVFASALMGTISGAPVANVVTTGTFTIPLMKRVGYPPAVAGAVEAVASTGGAFMPPIMGAGAFIMAEYLGRPYKEIALAALVPSALYYLALFLAVDAQAVRLGLKATPASQLAGLWQKVVSKFHLAVPLAFLIGAIMMDWNPMRAAFWASLLAFATAWLSRETRPTWRHVVEALDEGSRHVMPIAAACAAAGIIVGVISITGVGAKLATAVVGLSGGNPLVALALSMVVAIILGCGMPITAVYIILAATLANPLIQMGITPLAAHMFMFIFACVAGLTPPVAPTAYAGAALADANPNKTGFIAFRMALPAFILPFLFATSPALLLDGAVGTVIRAVVTATIGIMCFVAAFEGYLFVWWPAAARVFLGAAAVLMLDPGVTTDIVGTSLIGLATGTYLVAGFMRKARPASPPTA